MHIEDFKTWHWMLLGPIIGLIFGCVLLWGGPSSDVIGIETLDQGRFERAASGIAGTHRGERLLPEYAAGQPWLKGLVVHPPLSGDPTNTYWVLGKYYSVETVNTDPHAQSSPVATVGTWMPFRYGAKSPYDAALAAPGVYPTILDYLKVLQHNTPQAGIAYRYAWWDGTAPTLALPALAGLLIIGIAWPMTIHLIQRAGLAPVPQPKIKLPKSRPAAAKAAVDHSAGDQQLAELNAQLEGDLAAGASSSAPGVAVVEEAAPVKSLTAGPAEAAAAAAEQERLIREYGGEFYPVVKTVHKEGDKPEKKA